MYMTMDNYIHLAVYQNPRFTEIIFLDLGHVGDRTNPILFQNIWHLNQSILVESLPTSLFFLFHHSEFVVTLSITRGPLSSSSEDGRFCWPNLERLNNLQITYCKTGTRYAIAEASSKITHSIVFAKHDTLRDVSIIYKAWVTYVTLMRVH